MSNGSKNMTNFIDESSSDEEDNLPIDQLAAKYVKKKISSSSISP